MEARYGTRNIALATWGTDTNHHPLGTILAPLSLGNGAPRTPKRKAPADSGTDPEGDHASKPAIRASKQSKSGMGVRPVGEINAKSPHGGQGFPGRQDRSIFDQA